MPRGFQRRLSVLWTSTDGGGDGSGESPKNESEVRGGTEGRENSNSTTMVIQPSRQDSASATSAFRFPGRPGPVGEESLRPASRENAGWVADAVRIFAELDRAGLLEGVIGSTIHPHLPHFERLGDSMEKLDVLGRQPIDPGAPPHPFTATGRLDFDVLLHSKPD